jgi:glycosyltransferase involved in cell wall biosynthesis
MLLDIIGWLAVITAVLYSILLFRWAAVWRGSSPTVLSKNNPQGKSIIIPFRNDVDVLRRLLNQLHSQLKDVDHIEIIAVDDHTEGAIELGTLAHWEKLTILKNSGEGKKSALRTGVEHSKYESIITLDADVILSDHWWNHMCGVVTREDELIIFPIGLRSGFRWEQIEWSYLHGITGGSAMAGRALMANGSHVNFSKKIYNNSLPNEHSVSSGDDMFLLERTKQTGVVRYVYFSEPICFVNGNNNVVDFLNQRVRWAGKSARLRDADMVSFGMLSMVSTVLYLLLFVGVFLNEKKLDFLLFVIASKWLSEQYFFNSYRALRMPQVRVFSSLIFSVVYPLYTIFVALLALIYRPKWKGRPVKI